ncbi:Aste57867_13226 [Aphanomyces stellatus]|uniref:Palmitoyltransferase n=1 Tax=Aphanomyces stellatus TaxID=120398 RepID=A0A485KY17_9STRA|nr:hypothetical protein As57867_013177 [Aphanomyces stellatus]VFT90066.1 Aste57867_13226 [Aphanomyces stellatus]
MRVFCASCKEAEASADAALFDVTHTCKKCSGACAIPTVFECAQYGPAGMYLLTNVRLQMKNAGPVDINMRDEKEATMLHWACLNNRLLLVMYLLEFPDIDVNARGGDLQSTPIYWASHNNNIYTVALLLEHGADPKLVDRNGIDAYFVAVQRGFTILSSYLIAIGCDVDTRSQDDVQMTPLMWLCRYNFELDTMRMLFGLDANIHLTDALGNTGRPLHLAATSDFVTAAKQLVDHGADIYAKNNDGQTALDISKAVSAGIEARSEGKRTSAVLYFLQGVYNHDVAFQTFPLSVLKNHSQQTSFWMPWIVLGLGGYATHALHGVWILAGVAAALAVGYGLFRVAGLGVNPGKRKNAGLMLGVNVGSTFWITYVYLALLRNDRFSGAASALLIVLVAGILVSLYVTTTRDPGYIPTTYDERRRNIRHLVDMKSPSDVKLCTTCIQRRPLRSKHDAELNLCVARFDHFCPFVANAVGANNHTAFFGFLVFAVAAIGWFLVLAYSYFDMEGVLAEPTYWGLAMRAGHEHPVATCTTALSVIHIAWIGYLLLTNIYGILFAWTTNECVLQGRQPINPAEFKTQNHSKFSRGVVQNVIDFFHLPIGNNRIDWTKARFYTLADVHAQQGSDKKD